MIGERRLRRAAEALWPSDEYLRFMGRTRIGNIGWLARRAGQVVRGQ